MSETTPLQLLLPPESYPCTWNLALPGGDETGLFGEVELRADRPPRGRIHRDAPVTWMQEGDHASASFPQTLPVQVLRGELVNGMVIDLLDASVSVWTHGHANVSGRAALLARPSAAATPGSPTFKRVKVQIEHLDSIFGIGPLRSFIVPQTTSTHLAGTWSVEGEPDSSQEWSDDGADVRLEFDGSMSFGDPYGFRMEFSPVAVISTATALTLDEWLAGWVTPIRRLVSLSQPAASRT